MATVRPFRAIRPQRDKASRVVALPYDVMNRKEALQMAENNPFSYLHISRAEIDLPQIVDPYAPEVYEKAKQKLEENLQTGVFLREDVPAFYLYRQTMGGRTQTGIVGCVSVDEYGDNTIKKHELTRVEKETDRVCHFDVCNANTEPVFLTYRDSAEIRRIVETYASTHEAEYDFVGEDGIGHKLWVVREEAIIASVRQAFRSVDSLYIADGHHRSASAYQVGQNRRAAHPGYSGEEEFNYFMAVLYPDADLHVYDYNRVVKDLHGYTEAEFLEKLKNAGFSVCKKGKAPYAPQACHEFAMYLGGTWYSLTASDEIIPADAVGALDVSILQNRVLEPILNIQDPRTDKRIDFVGGIRGLAELVRRAETDMCVSFALYPVSVEDLMEISDEGQIMPPKSTWFEPKIGSGLFIHEL